MERNRGKRILRIFGEKSGKAKINYFFLNSWDFVMEMLKVRDYYSHL